MRVTWAVPCRYAEELDDLTLLIVGAGQHARVVPELPFDVPVYLGLCLAAPAHEWDEEHSFAIRMKHPDSHEIDVEEFPWPEERGVHPRGHPNWDFYLKFFTTHVIPADEVGGYVLDVMVDGLTRASVPILVHLYDAELAPE
jgi:hypothetical protein